MLTSYYAAAGRFPANFVPISISRGNPRGWAGLSYPRLAPTWEMLKMPAADYDRLFDAILSRLNPELVVRELEQMAGNRFPAPTDPEELARALQGPPAPVPVLLCWERPGEKCHRRRVAEWIEGETGLVVFEFGYAGTEYPRYADMPLKPAAPPRPKPDKPAGAAAPKKEPAKKEPPRSPSLFD